MFLASGKSFRLAKVGLMRAGLPDEYARSEANRTVNASVVIVRNTEKLCRVPTTGYFPPAILASGAVRRKWLFDNGTPVSWAYVEAGALEINADHEIGCSELMNKLNSLLLEKLYGPRQTPVMMDAWPSIVEVYPFENYFIFCLKGQKYRQMFTLDPVERRVGLVGGATPVKELFVNAQGDAKESMPRSETGHHYNYAHTRGQLQTISMGGKNSELVTQLIRNWSNINEAISMYLDYIKSRTNRQPMRPAFNPASILGNKVHQALAAHGIDYFDFAAWSAQAFYDASIKQTKSHSGEDVPMSQHAYVGDPKDPSTWHLPIDKPGRVRNALSRVNQTKGIPTSAKPAVLNKIRRKAKKIGIGVSEKPTGGQKQWMHKSVKSGMDRKWSVGVTPGPGAAGANLG